MYTTFYMHLSWYFIRFMGLQFLRGFLEQDLSRWCVVAFRGKRSVFFPSTFWELNSGVLGYGNRFLRTKPPTAHETDPYKV